MPHFRSCTGRLASALLLAVFSTPALAQDPLDIEVFADVPAPGQPEGIAVAPSGKVYAGSNRRTGDSTPYPSVLFEYDATGLLTQEIVIQGQNQANSGILGIAADGEGSVFVLDKDPPRVLHIDPVTGAQNVYATFRDVPLCSEGGTPGDCSAGSNDTGSTPNYSVFASDGTLYVSDSQQALIWRVPPNATSGEVWFTDALLEGVFGPNGLQFQADGTTLLLALTGSQSPGPGASAGALYELPVLPNGDPGSLSLFWTSNPADGPDAFSIANSGNIYLALAGTNQMVLIDPQGAELARFPTPAENALLDPPMDMPASTAFLGDRVLVTNHSLFAGNPNSWVIYDIFADETGLPLNYPLPEPSASLGWLAGALLLTGLRRLRSSPLRLPRPPGRRESRHPPALPLRPRREAWDRTAPTKAS